MAIDWFTGSVGKYYHIYTWILHGLIRCISWANSLLSTGAFQSLSALTAKAFHQRREAP